MKKLFICLVVLSSTSVFAQKLSYENLPRVKVTVSSADITSRVDARHEQKQKEALDELKAHVESSLNRQVIEAKCSAPVKEQFNNPNFSSRKSICSVSFL